jgi:hypothetical protein
MSFGCNNDISFETAIFRRAGCEAHVYDPTIDGSIAPQLKRDANGTLHLWGLGAPGAVISHNGRQFKTEDLATLMRQSDIAPGRVVDLLKVGVPALPPPAARYFTSPCLTVFLRSLSLSLFITCDHNNPSDGRSAVCSRSQHCDGGGAD